MASERRVRLDGQLVTKAEAEVSRFMAFVEKTDGCWLWHGSRRPKGYGIFWFRGERTGAHRASHALFVGPVVDGLDVCHRCDNPRCVRPDHLFLGTRSENLRDAVEKGRMRHPDTRGQRNGNSRLTLTVVTTIRERRANGERLAPLAEEFGVSQSTISNIARGLTWAEAA